MTSVTLKKPLLGVILFVCIDICLSDMPGTNPCERGPKYWCASKANAKKCKFDWNRCIEHHRKDFIPPQAHYGSTEKEPCKNGPNYWCKNSGNAAECRVKWTDCVKFVGSKDKSKPKCAQGSSYLCAKRANAAKCGFNYDIWCRSIFGENGKRFLNSCLPQKL